MLARAAQTLERARPVPPAEPVGALGEGVSADDLDAEAALDLEVALARRRRARVAEAQRGAGVVGTLGLSHQHLQHRADGVELGRSIATRRVEESAGREPWQQHQPGARRDRAEHRVRRGVDVEERQRGHQPVVAGQPHPVREPLPRHRVGAVGLGDELRAPGGARGGDEHRRVLLADLGRRRRRRAHGLAGDVVDREQPGGRGRPRDRLLDRRPRLGVGDDQVRPGLAGEAGELGGAAARVDGDEEGAEAHRGEPGE